MAKHDDIARFVMTLFDSDDIVEVRALRGQGESAQEWCRAAELLDPKTGIRLWIDRHVVEKWNVYVGVNPRARMGGASAEDVALAKAYFVDFDGGATPEQAATIIAGAGLPPPSLLVASGGGSHAYWKLTGTVTDWSTWRGVQKRLIALLGTDRVVHDPPRIMRLPGTLNFKYSPAVECRIVCVGDAVRTIGVAPVEETVRYLPGRAPETPESVDSQWQARLSKATREFLTSGAPQGRRNAELFKAACDLAGNGATFEQALSLLLDPARGCGLEDWEVEGTVRSAFARPRSPSKPPPTITSGTGDSHTVEAEVAGVRLVITEKTSDGRVVISARGEDGNELWRDKVDTNSSRSRQAFAKGVAARAGLGDSDVEEIDRTIMLMPEPRAAGPALPPRDPAAALEQRDDASEQLLDATPADILAEAEQLLLDPHLIDRVLSDIASVGVVGEVDLAATIYLQGCSRLLGSPLSVRVQGTSSSGKSHVIEKVASLFPVEHVLKATDLTPNALYYLTFGSLMHTFVVAGERSRVESDDKAEAKRALREMISAKELHKVMPVKLADGSLQTVIIHQPGPIAFVESTTSTKIFDEDENRCLQLSTDESPEQTERIVLAAAHAAASKPGDSSGIVQRHRALQRLLRRLRVQVPYAEAIAKAMPKSRPEARRAIGLAITMVQAVALLYQRQRGGVGLRHGDEIQADYQDYVIARRLLMGPLARALGGALPPAVARFGQRVSDCVGETVFSSNDLTDDVVTSKGKVNQYLKTLSEFGVVECVEASRGQLPAKWKFIADIPQGGALWLPTIEQIREVQ